MVAALTRIFGVHNLALAEDVVQDAFCRALEIWKLRGVPANPSAWLMTAAKNRALDILRRERTALKFAPDLAQLFASEWTLAPTVSEILAPAALRDDMLRMMFSCCQPRLPEAAQVALILHLLCGFSVSEVAGAFVSNHAAIEKRISRAKKVLASSRHLFDFKDEDFSTRLSAVRRALYLLFNEGYHGASADAAVRVDLCREAIRLVTLLLDNPSSATPATYGLAALMHFQAARLPSRIDAEGNLMALLDQDRSKWDAAMLAKGRRLLDVSASGREVSEYHIEAAIAAVHAAAPSVEETDWGSIVALYDSLLALHRSPVVELNRAIAIAQRDGPEPGIEAIEAIADRDRLNRYPFYPAALGTLELRRDRPEAARAHFQAALALARNPAERRFLEQRILACEEQLSAKA